MKIISLVGARPQFIKEALVGNAVRQFNAWKHVLVHSGQHYDTTMSEIFFQELGIPKPTYYLGIGGGSHAYMTAAALTGFEDILNKEKPDAILVYGDTNTTLAGALAAAKLHVPVIHVEAGIRMKPKNMPEEINRVLTDRISTVLCCCSALGCRNLAAEGLSNGVFVTGDVMYDLFLRMQPFFSAENACKAMAIRPDEFIFATLHRDYNVDTPTSLHDILEGLIAIQKEFGLPVLLPLHPRTHKRVEKFGLTSMLERIHTCGPIGYIEAMSLVSASRFVITDSGGLQKEAYYANKRCAVIMPDTGWRELIECGWNVLCSPEMKKMLWAAQTIFTPISSWPEHIYGYGQAASAIIKAVQSSHLNAK